MHYMSVMLIDFIFSSCIKLLSSDANSTKPNVQNQALFFFVIDNVITQEKIQKLLYFYFLVVGRGNKLPKFSN